MEAEGWVGETSLFRRMGGVLVNICLSSLVFAVHTRQENSVDGDSLHRTSFADIESRLGDHQQCLEYDRLVR